MIIINSLNKKNSYITYAEKTLDIIFMLKQNSRNIFTSRKSYFPRGRIHRRNVREQ
jgi:hypothetical protein